MNEITIDSPSVQSYLTILQGVINRMAANSAGCKTWCIALVSAIFVIIADKGNINYVWVSILPIILLALLDAYYLGLEKSFRDGYNKFISKLHSGNITVNDLFIVKPDKDIYRKIIESIFSLSVWPFYGLLLIMLLIVRYKILA